MDKYNRELVFRFGTKFFDMETGFYYYGFRYYLPEVGRWNSRDPLEDQGGLNLYVFVLNNPYGLYDPYGEDPIGDAVGWFSGQLGGTIDIIGNKQIRITG